MDITGTAQSGARAMPTTNAFFTLVSRTVRKTRLTNLTSQPRGSGERLSVEAIRGRECPQHRTLSSASRSGLCVRIRFRMSRQADPRNTCSWRPSQVRERPMCSETNHRHREHRDSYVLCVLCASVAELSVPRPSALLRTTLSEVEGSEADAISPRPARNRTSRSSG